MALALLPPDTLSPCVSAYPKSNVFPTLKPQLYVRSWGTYSCSILEGMISKLSPERLVEEGGGDQLREQRPERGGIKSSKWKNMPSSLYDL